MSTRIESSLRHQLVWLLVGIGAVALPAAPAAAACVKVPLYAAFYECDIYGETDLREATALEQNWWNTVHATLRTDVSLASPFSTLSRGLTVNLNGYTLSGEFTGPGVLSNFSPPPFGGGFDGTGTLVIYRAPDAIVVNGPNRHLRLGSDAFLVNLALGSSFQALAPLSVLEVLVGDFMPRYGWVGVQRFDTNGFDVTIRKLTGGQGWTLLKTGAGTLTIDGPTSSSATIVAGGTLGVSSDSTLGRGVLTLDGGTLRTGASFGLNRAVVLGPHDGVVDTNGFTVSLGGSISGAGGLTKTGAGVLILDGASTYLGRTLVHAGVLQLGPLGGLPALTALTLAPGATLDLGGTRTAIGSLDGSGVVQLGTGALTVGTSNSSTLFAGTIGGSGSLTKTGSGTWTLTGQNRYTGATTVSGGLLRIGAAGALPGGTALTVASGAALDGNDRDLALGSLAGSGALLLGGGALTVGTDNTSTTFDGSISGTGGVTKIGSGTLALTGLNSYSGPTTIGSGTLRVTTDANLGAPSSAIIMDGGGLQPADGFTSNRAVTVTPRGGTLTIADGTATLGGTIEGTGGLLKTGSGTLTLAGANTYSGGTTVGAGTLVGTSVSLHGALANAGLLAFAQTTDGLFSGSITGAGSVLKTGGGTLRFTEPQHYTGLTEVAAGRLNVSGLGGSALIDRDAVLATSGPIAGSVIANGTFINTWSPSLSVSTRETSGSATAPRIGGDLWLNPGATYTLPATGSALLSLPVNGHVTVAGARLNVVGDVSALSRVSTVPVFAARGGTSGGFAAVSAPSSLDVFMTTRGSNLLLTVERTDLPLAALATMANARAAATALDVARATATPDLHDVIRELAALPDVDVTTALGQLGGAGSAVALRLGALDGQEALRSIADRLTDLRLAARPGVPVIESADPQRAVLASAPAEDSRPSFWFRATGSDVSATAIHSEPRLQGGLLGVDRQMAEGRWRLGAFGGYDRAALIGDSGAKAVRDRRYRAGAYAMTTAGVAYVDAAVAGAYHRFETTRHFAFAAQLDPQLGGGPLFGGVARSAAARYEGHEVTGFVESGLRRTLGRVLVEPFAGIDASRVSSAGFAESGAGSVNLVGSDALTASLRAAVGLRATRSLTGPGARTFAPRVEVRYLHEALDPTATVRVAFADASANPFAITSPADGSHAIAPSAGFVLGLNRRLWLSADYRAVFAPTSRRHAVTLGLAF